jgi:hypothetical protein
MVFGLLTNWRFLGGVIGGIVVNQEIGQDQVRYYVENPEILMESLINQIKGLQK